MRYPWWYYGRKADFWIRYSKQIRDFITSAKLKPIPEAELMGHELAAPPTPNRAGARIPPPVEWEPLELIWRYGGRKGCHLHVGDDFFALTDEQWNKFAGGVIIDARKRLDNVKTVNLEQALELSEALEGMVG